MDQKAIQGKAHADQQRCCAWLKQFMEDGQPKFCTKEELRAEAMRQFGCSKMSFDAGWIMAIIDTGREDWFEPLRKRIRRQPQ